jgi:hypothetical protein
MYGISYDNFYKGFSTLGKDNIGIASRCLKSGRKKNMQLFLNHMKN